METAGSSKLSKTKSQGGKQNQRTAQYQTKPKSKKEQRSG